MMYDEKSCGAVVFTRQQGKNQYLLVQSINGHYGFPKGHVEPGESERETAWREVWEETGLRVTLLPDFRRVCEYDIPKGEIHKQVVYFLGEFENQTVRFRESEIAGGCLLELAQAQKQLAHEESRRILQEADAFLREKCCV